MSDATRLSLRERVDALSAAQRGALADAIAEAGESRDAGQLVAFVVSAGDVPPADALRTFVAERLPEYAVPSRFVFVDKLPRAAGGKLDRRALRHSVGVDADAHRSRATVAAPRSTVEATLAVIWKDVLKLDEVGVHDDFFEIGGDSLLSIRLIARAGRQGIRIAPERFFDNPTIAHMAAVASGGTAAGPTTTLTPSTVSATGEAPLTPIQHWFLDALPDHRDRWNQAYLVEIGHDLDASTIRDVVAELIAHHDALRMRLARRGGRWYQDFPPPNAEIPWRVVQVRVGTPAMHRERIEQEAEREHASVRLTDGRLFRAVLFEGKSGWRQLLFVGHHMVLDGVSWNVILEDLAMLVTQAASGEPLRLPERTASARAWALALADLASAPGTRDAAAYWLAGPNAPHDDNSAINLASTGYNRDAELVTLTLDSDLTRSITTNAPRRLDVSAQAVLLAALARAWCGWTGVDSLRVDLEGHGRDVLGDTLDVSRTVGWFTTVFPVHVRFSRDLVTAVQRLLDALPLRGAAHGLARHLSPDESIRAALAAQPRSRVLFNLLGTHDVSLPPGSRLRVLDAPYARPRDPDAVRPYALELNARIENGSLIITIEYSRLAYAAEDIARFTSAFRDALEQSAEPAVALPGIDAASLAIVADLLAEIDET